MITSLSLASLQALKLSESTFLFIPSRRIILAGIYRAGTGNFNPQELIKGIL